MAREAALAMLDILSETPPFSYMDIPKHQKRIDSVFTAVCGHLAYSLGEYQTAMLDFAEKSDCNEADRTTPVGRSAT